MTTALEIITDAYREGNINGIGVTPDANQQAEGLRRLQAVISGVIGFEVGEDVADWMVGSTAIQESDWWGGIWSSDQWTRPIPNARLLLNSTTEQTLYLPLRLSDGARLSAIDMLGDLSAHPVTLHGNGRRIENQESIVLNTDGLNTAWFYRADEGNWVRVTPIELAQDIPFPPEFDDTFITLLAMRINPRYGRSMSAESSAWLNRSLGKIKARYRQITPIPADYGAVAMTRYNYGSGYGLYGSGRGRFGWMN